MKSNETLRVARDLLGEKVAHVLRTQIIAGEIPVGTRLIEDDLAARMGTSRGPLRDALALLSVEGLVSTSPGRGTYVKGLTEASANELMAVRSILEEYAARLATARIRPEGESALRDLVDQMVQAARLRDLDSFVGLDLRIHRMIWNLSGNERLVDVLNYLIPPCSVLVRLNAETYTDWSAMVELHQTLADAIVSGDADEAARSMRVHIEAARREAMNALRSRSTDG